jgi:hypothetical protein
MDPEREADLSQPSGSEVRNGGALTSIPARLQALMLKYFSKVSTLRYLPQLLQDSGQIGHYQCLFSVNGCLNQCCVVSLTFSVIFLWHSRYIQV